MRIRKAIIYGAALMLALANIGCSDDEVFSDGSMLVPKEVSLGLQYSSFDLSSMQQSFENEVQGVSPWAFTNSADWISLSPATGSGLTTVSFDVTENTSAMQTRTDVLYLKSTDPEFGATFPMSVSQAVAAPYITLDQSNVSFSGKGGTETVNISTNVIPEMYSSPDWIRATVSTEGKTLTLVADSNTTGGLRSGTVYLRYIKGNRSVYESVNVIQSAASAVVGENSLTFENPAGSYTLKVTSDIPWTAYTSDFWITVSNGFASNSDTLNISVAGNNQIADRTGSVTISLSDGKRIVIKVTQRGQYIEFPENITDASDMAATYEARLHANASWIATPLENWLSVAPDNGTGSETLKVTLQENKSLRARIGHIVARSPVLSLSDTLVVTQIGKTFSVDSTNVSIGDKGGSVSIDIRTNGEWEAATAQAYDWLSVNPAKGDGSTMLNITATENTTTEQRIGYVNVKMFDKTYRIAVYQASKYFVVDALSTDFNSHGGTSAVTINTNDNWKVAVENGKTWLTTDKSESNGDARFTVTAADNASPDSRKGYIDVKSSYSGNVRLNYRQSGRFLNVDHTGFTFFNKGGTSSLVTVHTDGVYEITQDASWFTITKYGDNSFVVTTQPNITGKERTGHVYITETDLTSGENRIELPVRQLENGKTFIKGDFSADSDWNLHVENGVTVKVVGFKGDANWNGGRKNGATVSVRGYYNDEYWGTHFHMIGNFGHGNYGTDGDWNKKNYNNKIGGTSYGNDDNWNK